MERKESTNQPLFRKEALDHGVDRLHGDIGIVIPISWQVIGYGLLIALIGFLLFLSLASYARVESVSGTVVLDRGLVAITPTRSGIVVALSVREGDRVDAGAVLAQIRSEEDMQSGGTSADRVLDALAQQDARLSSQFSHVMEAGSAERARLVETVRGLAAEITRLDEQIVSQRRLIELADREFRSIQGVAQRGFISQRDLLARESALLSRRQQLAQLQQTRASKVADLAGARRGAAQSMASAQAQAAGVASNRAELNQTLADVQARRGYILRSPVAGTVTAMTARIGQSATQQQSLMIVVPANGRPRAELYVPTQAAGFLAVGQEVRLAVDAFPYQRFGTITARISAISSVAVPHRVTESEISPVYLVTAELADSSVVAFGRRQPLLPGMTLTARIVTERQSLFRWLFEPLFAIGRR